MVLEFDSQAEKFRMHSAEVQSLPMPSQLATFPLLRIFLWVLESGFRAIAFLQEETVTLPKK